MNYLQTQFEHPMDKWVRPERMPHIWCPGCGLGIVLSSLAKALERTGVDRKNVCVVSGIGCAGRMAGYIRVDSFHTLHGRAIPFAIGLKVTKPERKVIVVSGDGDLFAIGGNHIIHAARRNIEITVICVNNFNYGMTGGQMGPTTPEMARATTSPYGNIEPPFNLPYICASAGAVYVARWTALHVRRMIESFSEAIMKNGFSFVEVLSPCPIAFGRRNQMREGIDMMEYFREHSVIKNYIDPKEAPIVLGEKIVVGKFVDIEGKEGYTQRLKRLFEIARRQAKSVKD